MNATIRYVVAGLSAFLLALVLAQTAVANEYGGRYTDVYNDGTYVKITPHGFSPGPNNCVLYSTIAQDVGATRLLQAGVVRCNGTFLDGACDDVKFVEKAGPEIPGYYKCIAHGSFTNNVEYKFKVQRNVAGGGTFQAYINGTPEDFLGFFPSDVNMIFWAEWTDNDVACGFGGNVTFQDWQKYKVGVGWSDTRGMATVNNEHACWTLTEHTATREWDVSN